MLLYLKIKSLIILFNKIISKSSFKRMKLVFETMVRLSHRDDGKTVTTGKEGDPLATSETARTGYELTRVRSCGAVLGDAFLFFKVK